MSRNRETGRALARELEPHQQENEQSRILQENVRILLFRIGRALEEADRPLTAAEAASLARSLGELSRIARADQEQLEKLRGQIRREMREEARARLDVALNAALGAEKLKELSDEELAQRIAVLEAANGA